MKNAETMKMREEIKKHLTEGIIPFWKGMPGMTSSAVITVFWTTI